MYDLIIIGGGPAGLSAAIYAARYKLNTLIISKEAGGQMVKAPAIENWPGTLSVTGMELAKRFVEHVKSLDVEIKEEEAVDIIKLKDGFSVVISDGTKYSSKALLLALGRAATKSSAVGEEKYIGKGVSRCAICDAPLYAGKAVCVFGNDNAAFHSALLLAKYAKKIYLIFKDDPKAEPVLIEKATKEKKIEIIKGKFVKEVQGKKFVDTIILSDNKKLSVEGLFIESGSMPSTVIAAKLGVKLDKDKLIIVDNACATNVKGVFAAGDATTGSNKLMQILTASAEGAIAATSAYKLLSLK